MNTFYLFLAYFFQALSLVVLARALVSWFPLNPRNPLVTFLVGVTEPLLYPLRRILPNFGFLDLSPMVAIIVLQVLSTLARGLA